MRNGIYPKACTNGHLGSAYTSGAHSTISIMLLDELPIQSSDLLILHVGHKSKDWAEVPADWNLIAREYYSTTSLTYDVRGELYWRWGVDDEFGPIVVTISNTSGNVGIAAISAFVNCDPNDPIDSYTARANYSSTTGTAGITTSVTNAAIINAGVGANYLSSGMNNFRCANVNGLMPRALGNVSTSVGLDLSLGYGLALMEEAGFTGNSTYSSPGNNVGILAALKPDTSVFNQPIAVDITLTGTPSNTSATTSYTISSLPITISQSLENTTFPNEVWYNIPSVIENAFGCYVWTDAMLGSYMLEYTIYYGTPDNLTEVVSAGGYSANMINARQPMSVPTLAGQQYYLKVFNGYYAQASSNYSGVEAIIRIYKAPNEGVRPGDVIVYDDADSFPLVVLDPDDGHVRQIFNPFAYGEEGDILDDGTILVEDYANPTELVLYNPLTLSEQIRVTGVLSGNQASKPQPRIYGGHLSKFYVGYQDGNLTDYPDTTIYTVSPSGVVGGQTWSIPNIDGDSYLIAMAISNDESIAYYGLWDDLENIYRYDLTSGSSLGSIYNATNTTLQLHEDIRVLLSNNLLFSYWNWLSETQYQWETYYSSPLGVVSSTYAHSYSPFGIMELNHLQNAESDDYFWSWLWVRSDAITARYNLKRSFFKKRKLSDGSITKEFDGRDFADGKGEYSVSSTISQSFGNANSCTFFIARQTINPHGYVEPEPNPCTVCVNRIPGEYTCLYRVPVEIACILKTPESPICLERVC